MEWNLQTLGALIAIAIAGAYLAWRGWQSLHPGKSGCARGCGCGPTAPPSEPTIRLSTSRLEKKA